MGWFSKNSLKEDPKTEKLRNNLKNLEEKHKEVLDRGDIDELKIFEKDIEQFKIDIAKEQTTNTEKYRIFGASSALRKRQAERVSALLTLNNILFMIRTKKAELLAISLGYSPITWDDVQQYSLRETCYIADKSVPEKIIRCEFNRFTYAGYDFPAKGEVGYGNVQFYKEISKTGGSRKKRSTRRRHPRRKFKSQRKTRK
jgi:hypothetical protein